MSFGLRVTDISEQVRTAFYAVTVTASPSVFARIQNAAMAAIHQAGSALKTEGRANISAAGFSYKWQNTWKVKVYPETGASIDAAAFGYHKIPYSLVFENGARIRASGGLLWLPLPTVPKDGRRAHFTARRLAGAGVKLFSITRPGKAPLLATNIRATQRDADTLLATNRGRKSAAGRLMTLAKLRKGTTGKRGVVSTVPLFVGVDSVSVRKRFDLAGVANKIAARVPNWYAASLET